MTVLYQHRLLASGTLDFGSKFDGEKESWKCEVEEAEGLDTRVS